MKKQHIFLILAIIMVALIALAAVFYNSLSDDYFAPEETTGQTTVTAITEEIIATPSFTVTDKNGKDVKLSDFFGKPIVVNFWASWCNPCTSEMPHFEEVYKEYGSDIHFLMINVGDSFDESFKFASNNGYSFPVYHDTTYEASYVYGVSSIPLSLFINKNGELVTYQLGAMSKETLENKISMIK